MNVQIVEGARSNPAQPVWVWRVWWCGRCMAMGFCGSEAEAKRQAERAKAEAERSRSSEWSV